MALTTSLHAAPVPASSGLALLAARDLFKMYRDAAVDTVALRGANLEIRRGEIITLLGPSGSGKSTLLSVMAGITLPSAGQVLLDGADLTRLPESARARARAERVGIVFQRGNLIPFLSAMDNVALPAQALGRRDARQRARRLLEAFGLASRLDHYPRQLSGGEAQRAAIASALANDPDVLLGDEITGELDSATAGEVMDVLLNESRRRGLALLIVTHNRAVAELGQRQLVMRDGQVLAS